MKKTMVFTMIFILFSINIFSQQINEEELKNKQEDIKFNDYTGKPDFYNTVAEIKNIGITLANSSILSNVDNFTLDGKYKIETIIAPDEEGLDAIVLTLNPSIKVDHIKNLRLILQGYLETAFGYNSTNSEVIARYITIYNAVYRQDIDFFTSKYKPSVLKILTKEKAGLSTNYNDWPGKSQIVIPLNSIAKAKDNTSLKVDEFIDDKVKKEVKKENKGDVNKTINQQQDLINTVQDTNNSRKDKIQKIQDQIDKANKEIKDIKKQIQNRKKKNRKIKT